MKHKPIYLQSITAGDYVTVREAARLLKMKEQTIRNKLFAGTLTRYKYHSMTLISKQEVS